MKIIVILVAIIFAIGCISEPNIERSPEYKSSRSIVLTDATLQARHKLEAKYAKIIITGVVEDQMAYKFAEYPLVSFRDKYVLGSVGDTVIVVRSQLLKARYKKGRAREYYELIELVKNANNTNW